MFSPTPPTGSGDAWDLVRLYDFPAAPRQHGMALSLCADGLLYGTTDLQGSGRQGGTIFSLTPPASQGGPWTERTLWQFPTIRAEGVTSDQPQGSLLIRPQTAALFGATGDYNSPGVLFELVPPSSQGSGWSRQVLPPKNTLDLPILGLGTPGALYGADSGTNVVWSLTP